MENPFKPLLKKAPFLFNKFVVVGLAFIIWIVFFDRFDKVSGAKIDATISKLEGEKVQTQNNIVNLDKEVQDILKDKESYVRKNGYLKKPGEEVFIIEEE